MTAARSNPTAPPPVAGPDVSRVTPPPSVWLLVGVLLGFWAVLAQRLSGSWTALPEYSYGWVVPLLCAMLFWERWQRRPPPHARRWSTPGKRSGSGEKKNGGGRAPTPHPALSMSPARASAPGLSAFSFLLAAFLLALFILSRVSVEVIPTWRFALWGLAVAVAGLTWLGFGLMGGGAWARHFFFPIAFFLLAVPWPTQFEYPFIQTLTQLNASFTVELMSLLGVTSVRMGNLILIEPGMVGVQEACSGIRSFQSTLMVALFLGELFRFNLWRRVVFVVLGAGCSMFFNILRTSFLVWSCDREGLGAVDKFHDPAGWAVFAASFAVLALLGWRLKRGDDREKAERARQRAEAETAERPQGSQPCLTPARSRPHDGPEREGKQGADDGRRTRDEIRNPTADGGRNPNSEFRIPNSDGQEPAPINREREQTAERERPQGSQPYLTPALSLPHDGPEREEKQAAEAEIPGAAAHAPRLTPPPLLLCGGLLLVLLATELGLRAWFATHRQARAATIEWELAADAPRTRELPITRQVESMLAYDHGEGWETQNGPERWQGFYFRWDAPKTLGRRIICNTQVLGHQPEVCFTAAGMQVRQVYGYRRYVAHGVPLVFKVYEFSDRNVPIFVFSATWERGVEQALDDGLRMEGAASTARGFSEARLRLARGDRGVIDEARVLKLGVWGPRTLAEAEAALQRQLELLIQPGKAGG